MDKKTEKLNEVIAFIKRNPEWVGVEFLNRIKELLNEKNDKLIDKNNELIDKNNELIDDLLLIESKNELIKISKKEIEFLKSIISEYGLLSEREYSVYVHILPNNTIYIGQTKQDLKERWQNGRGYKNNNFFDNLIKKFGWNNIDHLLYKDNLTKFEADTIEKDLIKFYSENEHITGRVVLNIRNNE